MAWEAVPFELDTLACKGYLFSMERTDRIAAASSKETDDIAKADIEDALGGRFPTHIRTASDIHRAAEAMRDLALAAGNFRVAACANIASKTPMRDADGNVLASQVFGWPASKEQWWRKPLLALSSPLPQACRYEGEPFWANADGIYTRLPNDLLEQLDFSHFKEQVNASSVIVVPIHLPFGQIGAVSFSPTIDQSDLSHEFNVYADLLEFHSRRFISGYSRVTSNRPWIPRNCRLSKREVECLRWAAVGKTDMEIALIIGRSCATVRFHIHNAANKLEAVNRSQTVFKATQLGFLGGVATKDSEALLASATH